MDKEKFVARWVDYFLRTPLTKIVHTGIAVQSGDLCVEEKSKEKIGNGTSKEQATRN